jgi:hypothetical protein
VEDQLIDTWAIHDRINCYLLQAVPPEALGNALAPKHRTIYQLFSHIHNVRLMWLKSATPELLTGLSKLEGETGDKAILEDGLIASGSLFSAPAVGQARAAFCFRTPATTR